MPEDKVHRDLRLTTPVTQGPDVKALQQALNEISRQFPRILGFELDEDGKLGEETFKAAFKAAHIMGLPRPSLNMVEKKHVIGQPVQRLLRNPDGRTEPQKQRAKARREALAKKLDRRPSLSDLRVTSRSGKPHWGGSGDVMAEFVEPFLVKRGLPLGSGKRTPEHNRRIGGSPNSDHLTTKSTTAARDFPTFTGEDDARALARAMGSESWRPNSFDGFRFSAGDRQFVAQILWGAGIDHGDHIHVGISPV